jgi:hypothetical protein
MGALASRKGVKVAARSFQAEGPGITGAHGPSPASSDVVYVPPMLYVAVTCCFLCAIVGSSPAIIPVSNGTAPHEMPLTAFPLNPHHAPA